MTYESLQYEVSGHVATVTLNRPDKLNALNATLRDELNPVCHEVYEDDEVRAVILTGAGNALRTQFSGHWAAHHKADDAIWE